MGIGATDTGAIANGNLYQKSYQYLTIKLSPQRNRELICGSSELNPLVRDAFRPIRESRTARATSPVEKAQRLDLARRAEGAHESEVARSWSGSRTMVASWLEDR